MRSRQPATASASCSSPSCASEVACSGPLTITSCAPIAGCERKRSASAPRVDAPADRSSWRGRSRPARRVRRLTPALSAPSTGYRFGTERTSQPGVSALAAAGPVGPDLGRGLVLAARAERTSLGRVGLRLRRLGSERIRALGPAGREDRPQPGELVDPDLWRPGPRRGAVWRERRRRRRLRGGSATTERSTAREARAAA